MRLQQFLPTSVTRPCCCQIMFRIYHVLRETGFKKAVVFDVADTDVIVQTASVAHEMEGLLGLF